MGGLLARPSEGVSGESSLEDLGGGAEGGRHRDPTHLETAEAT